MSPRDAVLTVLREAGEPLHWTVIQDRALRAGHVDPFEVSNVRRAILGALNELVRDGLLRKEAKGVYVYRPTRGASPDQDRPDQGQPDQGR